MARNDNRLRALSDAVSVDAWHQPFAAGRAVVDLHADVAFTTARVGADEGSPIRFRLSIRRAELVVVVPEVEPVAVVPGSVSRDTPQVSGQRVNHVLQQAHASVTANASLSSAVGFLPLLEATGAISHDASADTEITTQMSAFVVTQSQTMDGYYRWTLEPGIGDRLLGHPWDAAGKPRLRLQDHRERDEHLPAVVRVEVRCRREDLIIESIVPKDSSVWSAIQQSAGFGNKMAAAESYIRDRLVEVGLEFQNFDDPFGELTLASVTAKES